MASTVLDSDVYKDIFGTAEMRAIFSDDAMLAGYVTAEVALAVAQGRVGVIPAEHAAAIAAKAPAVVLDRAKLKADAENVGYPIVGLVKQLGAGVGEAGRFLHWGATTQDIMDTGVVLQVRDGLSVVEREIEAIRVALAKLARHYRTTAMAGRTHLQQALPITFGYKAAIWLSMMDRHAERLAELKARVLVAQLGGAVGTLASLGDNALAVKREYARELGLAEPAITWHVARDGLVETVNFLALVAGSLGKIGFDVMLLMATEIGEASEPFAEHRGSSSTMPQKRNPISSELLVANAKAVRQQAGLMLDAMVSDLERASGPWHIEWMAVPESFVLTAGALAQARFLLEGLTVDEARMMANLNATNGLIVAEAVMMGLAPAMGRQAAHDAVYEACREAITGGGGLLAALSKRADVTAALSPERLARLCDPANYVGAAPQMVDAVLAGRGG